MSSNNSFSNAATFVGRYKSFLNKTEKAANKPLVIAYIISRNQENMSWNVMTERKNLWCSGRNNSSGWCEPADEEKRKDRLQEAVKNDAVGRKLKIFRSPDESGLRKHQESVRFNLISHLQ